MFNKIIVTANPSFATKKESSFWTHFDRVCEREGWRLFKHSMRKIAEDPRTLILPARLSDVAGFLQHLPGAAENTRLPAWLNDRNFETIIEWERRRWQLHEVSPKLALGLTKLAWHVDHLFKTLRPAGTIVSNKIDHGTALFYFAAQYYGSKPIFFERSPLETFIVEDEGMFGESEIWSKYADEVRGGEARFLAQGRSCMAYLATNPDGFRPQEFDDPSSSIAAVRRAEGAKFFLPMDNTLWTGWAQEGHWQGELDHYPGTPTPSEAINHLARIAARHRGTLFIKKHPSDVQAYQITEPNVVVVDAPLNDLISACDTCINLLTKVAFVSAAMGKPTVTLGPNTVAASGGTFHADRLEDWESVIDASLAAGPEELAQKQEKVCNLMGWLDQRFYLDSTLPADFEKPSALSLLTKIAGSPAGQNAGSSLSALDHLFSATLARFANKKLWLSDEPDQTTSLTLVYDVTRLANTRLRHSGISRFAQALLTAFRTMPNVDLVPVMCKSEVLARGDFKNDLPGFSRYLGAEVYTPDQIDQRVKGRRAVYFSPYDELHDLGSANLPRVATVHDVLHLTASEWYFDPKARVHIDTVLASLGAEDTVVTVSEFTRMQLLRVKGIAPERVITVHLAADDAFCPAHSDDVARFRESLGLGDDPYFVLFGQFESRKNVPTTLSAIRAVTTDPTSRAKFVVIGSAIGTEALRKAIAHAGLPQDRIVFFAGPEDPEIAVAYSGACGMLYVSLAEGFGLPVIEAMKCSCPVVTSAVTSIPEVAGDGVLYVDPYDVKQIAAAILALEGSASLRRELGQKALRRSAEFTWHRTAEGILSAARTAALRGPSPPIGMLAASGVELAQLRANFEALSDFAAELEQRLAAGGRPLVLPAGNDLLDRLSEANDPDSARLVLTTVGTGLLLDGGVMSGRMNGDVKLRDTVARALAALPEDDKHRRQYLRVTQRFARVASS